MAKNITLIRGDGIGPEIAEVVKKCIEATGFEVIWEEVDAGIDIMKKEGTPLPEKVIESIKKNKVALKAPVTTPVGTGFRSVNVALRQRLNLFACVRPCKTYEGVRSKYKNIDLVIIRENTEDLYSGIEFEEGDEKTKILINGINDLTGKTIKEDSGISIKPISISATRKIVQYAFEYVIKNKRKKVTAVHKANIMKFTDGLFLEVARDVAKKYSNIEFNDVIIDNMCMQLVQKPDLYDVLVLPNLYGDIISDLCAGLVGGLGIAPGANIGDDLAVFEAVHGSAPKYKGLNKVNPTALILSGVLMLRYIGETEKADKLELAVTEVIKEGKYVTYDMKENRNDKTVVGTKEMGEAIIRQLKI
ncbi:MAG: isocitrate/isopropylmalate dehydrogenase family protein [Candidatus Firestonebacteria bacterium]